jgi:hypothetical protein
MPSYKVKVFGLGAELNDVFETVWGAKPKEEYQKVLECSLSYGCVYTDKRLVGFVNLAWDGGIHAFILDTTAHVKG